MINAFETLFEARERKFQQEKLFRGESVDLVAKITTDGVPDSLDGYAVEGYYQPVDYVGTDDEKTFYSVPAEIADGKVTVHWTYDRDFGKTAYNIWALLTKSGEQSYPVCWRLALAHSPSYPVGEAPDPLPQTIDFSKYEVLNAPWALLSDFQDFQEEVGETYATKEEAAEISNALSGYLPLSGGDVTQTFQLKSFGRNVLSGLNGALAIGIDSAARSFGVAIGYKAKSEADLFAGVAVGEEAKANGKYSVALGTYANAKDDNSTALGSNTAATGAKTVAVGFGAKTSNEEAIAVGYGSNANAQRAIQIGYGTNATAKSLKVFDKMVLSGDNLTLDPERIPYLSAYETKQHAIDTYQTKSDAVADLAFVNGKIDGVATDLSTNYATKSDMLVATTHINDLSSSLSGTQVQMALYDGRFALPETVVQRADGTIELYDFNGTLSFEELSSAFGEISWIHQQVMAISFGSNLSAIHIGPNFRYWYSGTSTAVFSVTDSDEILSAKAQYLTNAFRLCKTINIPSTINSYDFYQGGNVLSTETLYTGNQRIGEFTIGNSDSCPSPIEAFAFCGLSDAKQITIRCPASYTVRFAPHFIDYCTNLEVLDLRDIAQVYHVIKTFKIGYRVQQLSYEPKIENVNPNLKIIVSDSEYTRLMGLSLYSTWHPYLVKASDWEAVKHSEISSFVDEDTLSGALSSALSDYYTKKEADETFLTEHQSLSNYYTKTEVEEKIAAAKNTLHYATAATIDLTATQSVYKTTAIDGVLPIITSTNIPTSDDYFCFEVEVAVPSDATLDSTAWASVTWLPGFELPQYDYAGKTLYISCRLDCQTRGVTASCWRVA